MAQRQFCLKGSSQEIPTFPHPVCVCMFISVFQICCYPTPSACQQAVTLPIRGGGGGGVAAGGLQQGQNNAACQESMSVFWSHNTTDLFLLRKRKRECMCMQLHRLHCTRGEVDQCVCVSLSLTVSSDGRLRPTHVLPTDGSSSSSKSRADASTFSGATNTNKQEVNRLGGGPLRARIDNKCHCLLCFYFFLLELCELEHRFFACLISERQLSLTRFVYGELVCSNKA